MAHATFTAGDITAVIGDNGAEGEHRAGYNGVWSLTHAAATRSVFVPGIAGLNLEHVFDGEHDVPPEVFFEPRNAPMTFGRLSETEAELHQPPTPTFHVESWTRFALAPPHYVDMSFRCRAHQHAFRRGYMGVFWASYVDGPEDKSMYFLGVPDGAAAGTASTWMQLCTPAHGDGSTVPHRNDTSELTFREGHREALYRSLSPLRFDLPLFYGHFDDLVWVVMFDRTAGLRLTHSPSGGGANAPRRTTNPAWDFQLIVPEPEVMTDYALRVRTALRPRCGRDEILREYEAWAKER
jgi:hypothetical protein